MSFIPDSFLPPPTYHLPSFTLDVLSPKFADQDFLAVTENAAHLRYVFGPHNGWPAETMSFSENLADLQRHEREFIDREAFAYSMLSHDGKDYLGCLYITPVKSRLDNDLRKSVYDARVFFWLTQEAESRLPVPSVLEEIKMWLQSDWPFKNVAFPGRTIGWQEWEEMARPAPDPL